jgi:hypothetical protein
MGEYWKPVNLTKREFIHPHHVGNGLKLPEWWGYDSNVVKAMKAHWSPDDDVRAVSDYGGTMRLSGNGDAPYPDYETLEDEFIEIK